MRAVNIVINLVGLGWLAIFDFMKKEPDVMKDGQCHSPAKMDSEGSWIL